MVTITSLFKVESVLCNLEIASHKLLSTVARKRSGTSHNCPVMCSGIQGDSPWFGKQFHTI